MKREDAPYLSNRILLSCKKRMKSCHLQPHGWSPTLNGISQSKTNTVRLHFFANKTQNKTTNKTEAGSQIQRTNRMVARGKGGEEMDQTSKL